MLWVRVKIIDAREVTNRIVHAHLSLVGDAPIFVNLAAIGHYCLQSVSGVQFLKISIKSVDRFYGIWVKSKYSDMAKRNIVFRHAMTKQ